MRKQILEGDKVITTTSEIVVGVVIREPVRKGRLNKRFFDIQCSDGRVKSVQGDCLRHYRSNTNFGKS